MLLKSTLTVVSISALLTTQAIMAQGVTSTIVTEENPRLKRTSIEVRLLESLASAVPGLAAGGLEVESYLGDNFAIKVGGTYADIDLPMSFVNDIMEDTDDPMVDRGYAYSTGAGMRYYDSPVGNSLYGDLSVDYSEAHTGWEYDGESYDSARYAVTPSLAFGYRWVWESGFLVRLGAGAGLASVDRRRVDTLTSGPNAEEGKRKIEDLLDQSVVAKVDLGVGAMF